MSISTQAYEDLYNEIAQNGTTEAVKIIKEKGVYSLFNNGTEIQKLNFVEVDEMKDLGVQVIDKTPVQVIEEEAPKAICPISTERQEKKGRTKYTFSCLNDHNAFVSQEGVNAGCFWFDENDNVCVYIYDESKETEETNHPPQKIQTIEVTIFKNQPKEIEAHAVGLGWWFAPEIGFDGVNSLEDLKKQTKEIVSYQDVDPDAANEPDPIDVDQAEFKWFVVDWTNEQYEHFQHAHLIDERSEIINQCQVSESEFEAQLLKNLSAQ